MIIPYKGYTPDVEKALFIAENAVITGNVIIEEGASVWFGAVIRGDVGQIRIGRNTNIQDNCVLHCDEGCDISIGANVVVGHGAIVHGCRIEDDSMVGMGAIIMNDAVIGRGSVVGAGSLVTERKVFPERSLIMGSPAKAVKTVPDSLLENTQKSIEEYKKFAEGYLAEGRKR